MGNKTSRVHLLQCPANRDVQLRRKMSIVPLNKWGCVCCKVITASDLTPLAHIQRMLSLCTTRSVYLCFGVCKQKR